MKTFKEYRNKKIKFVDGPLSFAELREKKSGLSESVDYNEYPVNPITGNIGWHDDQEAPDIAKSDSGERYDSRFHDPIQPETLTETHKQAIVNYTSMPSKDKQEGYASSGNINAYLRNCAGNKTCKVIGEHSPEYVHHGVKLLSSAFTPENTNKREIETYGAVPSDIGGQLESLKKGDIQHFAGFTSTSSRRETAMMFAMDYVRAENTPEKIHHVVSYHVMPRAGLSVVHQSNYDENEVLLHHGARIEYSHTDHYINDSQNPFSSKLHIHHVIVHPEHAPLESYGSYTE